VECLGLYSTLGALFLLTMVGVLVGIRLAIAPWVVRASGALLVAIALVWILPEIAERLGWFGGVGGVAGGFAVLWIIDHYLYPICPTCSHTHSYRLAAPLLIAAGVHSFFDGWSLAISQEHGYENLRAAFLIGIGIHKLPEGLALGALLRSLPQAALAQSMMFAGAFLAMLAAPYLGQAWSVWFLSVAAGAFVYLGYHAALRR